MSKPKAPTPPDPQQTAQAQTESNRDTAISNSYLNNVNQVTPYGSVNYNVTGQGPNGVPQWTQTTTESANQQKLREGGENLGIGLNNLGQSQLGRVNEILGTNYTPGRFDTNAATGGKLDLNKSLGGAFNGGAYDPTRLGILDAEQNDPTHMGIYDASKSDPTGMGRINSGAYDPTRQLGDFGADVRQRSFDLATQGLDKQFDRGEEALRTRLANQGVNAGTEAFGSEMSAFNEGKGNAYADALFRADANATAQRGQAAGELSQGFNQNLAGRQNWADLLGQDFGQNMASRDQAANFLGQDFGQQLASRGQTADLLGQGFNQNLAGRGQNLSELLTERGTNLGEAQGQYGMDQQADLLQRQTPLNEILALMNGGTSVASPINPANPNQYNIAGTDIAGINANAWNAQNQNYQTRMSGWNSLMGGLAGLGGSYLGGR